MAVSLARVGSNPAGGGQKDADIGNTVDGGTATVERKYPEHHKPWLLDGESETQLTMLACSQPPEGRAEWLLQLLDERFVELQVLTVFRRRRSGGKEPVLLAEGRVDGKTATQTHGPRPPNITRF